jgi:Tol biopolymer transport system component
MAQDGEPLVEAITTAASLSGGTNVRANPSTDQSPIETLAAGQRVVVLATIEDGQSVNGNSVWYHVELEGGVQGFVWSGALGRVETERRCLTYVEPDPGDVWLVQRQGDALIRFDEETGRFSGRDSAGGQPDLWTTLIPPDLLTQLMGAFQNFEIEPISDSATCTHIGSIVVNGSFRYLAVRETPNSPEVRFVIAASVGEPYLADEQALVAIKDALEALERKQAEAAAVDQIRENMLRGEKISFSAVLEGTRTDQDPSGRSRIFVATPDGSYYGRLTANPDADYYEMHSDWSSDGRYISYVHSNGNSNIELATYDVVIDAQRRTVTAYRAEVAVVTPSWSPNGQSLAVLRIEYLNGRPGRRDIGVMPSDLIRINADFMVRNLTVSEWWECDAWIEEIDWSPSGEQIAFTASGCEVDDPESLYVYVIDAQGNNLRRLGPGIDFDWSYDGQQLLIFREGNVYVLNNDGSDERLLISGQDAYLGSPVWSPVDNRIAYLQNSGVSILNLDTGRVQRVISDAYGTRLVWSPDGRRFAFTSYLGRGPWHQTLSVMDTDGSNRVVLVEDFEAAWDMDLAWAPAPPS